MNGKGMSELKALPYNINAEQSVLGAILIDPSSLTEINIQPNDFYRIEHQKIMQAILDLKENPIDVISVADVLKKKNQLESVGGIEYLARLSASVANSANVAYYAQIIQEDARKRELIKVGNNITQMGFSGMDVEAILLEAKKKLDTLHIASPSKLLSEDVDLDEIERFVTARVFHTHFPTLNRSARIMPGEFIVVVGDFSKGKTMFAMNIMKDIAHSGGITQFFTLDMIKIQLLSRIATMEFKIPSEEMKPDIPGFTERVLNAHNTEFAKHTVLEKVSYLSDIISKIRVVNPDFVVIDYIQNVDVLKNESKVDKMDEILHALKDEAQNRPIMILSQLSKAQGSPTARSKGSSSIPQEASLIIEVEKDEDGFKYKISKNRSFGEPTGWVRLNFDHYNLFERL